MPLISYVGDIGASRALKSFRVNPDNEGNTIEINVNININGTNADSDIDSPRNLSNYDLYLDGYFFTLRIIRLHAQLPNLLK